MPTTTEPAGRQIRRWRQRRRLSQLALSELANTSTRHLSCVETGRACPSREMVLRLADALEVPLRETNLLLLGAGLAPAYPDARIDHVARAALLDMLDRVLEGHLPNPALVLDAEFDVVATNTAVDRLLGALVDPDLLDPPVNVVRVTLHPRGLAPHLANMGPWRAHLLRQVRQHASAAPSESLDALLAETQAFPHPQYQAPEGGTFALPMQLRVGKTTLRLFSTVATFGTPLDVAASELAIETFVPADATTRAWLKAAGT
ncbi:MAG: helix-turn-helix transcriptional regulator [Actinobacteria bacterium]|nr:helix-turn-helix transcriptional regulator [Actinomycetota bacterium]